MTKRASRGEQPPRGQALRSAAEAALTELAAGARSADEHGALARGVLRLGLARCAEVHHPAGAARFAGTEESFDPAAVTRARWRLREAAVPDPYELGAIHEALLATRLAAEGGRVHVASGGARRSAGAHYTPEALAREVAQRAIAPLLRDDAAPEDVLALRVCDAAMGAGAFLLAACDVLAERLVQARAGARTSGAADTQRRAAATTSGAADTQRRAAATTRGAADTQRGAVDTTSAAACENATLPCENAAPPRGASPDDGALLEARREVARTCLFGVDKDPAAVALARAALWIATASEGEPAGFLGGALCVGDALVGPPDATPPWPCGIAPFDWGEAFADVVKGRGGFDAIVGNPPWISYAGRAAQPLDSDLFDFYKRTSPAFFGYRNLQALFVHRAATLLRPGGRLGLVVPTSMCDLSGYEPSRRAHDALCAVDEVLPDFGDRFDDVFQPCMGLFSTRRAARVEVARTPGWPLERDDLDARSAALLARLDALPKVPADCFGERGFQSVKGDVSKMRPGDAPPRAGEVGLRIGGDVAAFRRSAPSFLCDPHALDGRFREEAEWREVSVLVRQTARFPMACLADGVAFRNSVLAGFATQELPAELLVAYVNAWPVRWFHYVRHRDARQGMPQMKIAHLRALPSPADDREKRLALAALGATLSLRNDGVRPDEQRAIDDLAADLLGLDDDERALVRAWAATFAGA